MKYFTIILSFLLISSAGSNERDLTLEEKETLQSLAREIIKEAFPTLKDELNKEKSKFRLKFYTIKSPQYFMQSNFTVKRFLFGTPQYRIGVNPLIFDRDIPKRALKGVLAHELVHTEDYFNGSTIRTIIPIGLKVIFKKSRAKYERATDRKVVKKGFGLHLKEYRVWQYEQLTEEQIARKKKEYLSPEEIDDLINQ